MGVTMVVALIGLLIGLLTSLPGFGRHMWAVAAALVMAGCSPAGSDEDQSAASLDSAAGSTSTAASGASPTLGSDTVRADDPGSVPGLAARPCPTGHPPNAVCSTFTVAADRLDPAGGTIELPVVVLPATRPSPAPDALVIPAGGPGNSGTDDLFWAASRWNERRDIVLYDQRGTGQATPSLECPAVNAALIDALRAAGSYVDERDAMTAAREGCLAGLEDAGVDLSDYHSEASADDLDELRAALGYEQWNLLGISYGSRLALATMRSHPDGVRAVILDSVDDVTTGNLANILSNADRAFRHLADGCAADPACAADHGDLTTTIDVVRQRYNTTPVSVEIDVDRTDDEDAERFVITGDDMIVVIFNALYDADLIPRLPSIIDDLAAGDTTRIPALLQRSGPAVIALADAMTFSVDCADHAGLDTGDVDAAAFAHPGRFGPLTSFFGLCPSDWPATPGEFNTPIESAIPALVLAGSYDPVTPPDGSRRAADTLTNSTFVLVEPAGHAVTFFDSCIAVIELAFLDDPTTTPDTACVAAFAAPNFQ